MPVLEQLIKEPTVKQFIERGTSLSEINIEDIAPIPTGRSLEATPLNPECPNNLSTEPNCGSCAWGLLTAQATPITNLSDYIVATQYNASCGRNIIVKNPDGVMGAVRKNVLGELFFFQGIPGNFAFEQFKVGTSV